MKKAKIIERIAVIAFCCVIALTAGIIPIASYSSHKAYVDRINANKPKPVLKAQLVSIDAKLKDGVEYFANNKAQVRAEDIAVTANFEKGDEKYSEEVPSDKFAFEVNDRFAFDGGNITVTYRTKQTTIPVTLTAVKLQSLSVLTKPYRVYYKTGSKFNPDGLTVNAVYNDGSVTVVGKDALSYDADKVLAKTDKSVTVSYAEKDITKTLEVPVTVSDEVIDGKVKKLIVTDYAYVLDGELLSTATASLLGEYESGNTLALSPENYTIEARTERASIGRKYTVKAVYNEDSTVEATIPAIVRKHIEGEDGTFIGSGKAKTETEYFVVDGQFVSGDSITFAGGFGEAVRNNKESSVLFTYEADGSGFADMTLRCANGNRRHDENGYYMTALQVNTVLDIYVNGKIYEMNDDVILAGVDVKSHNFVPCYNVYNTFVCPNVPVQAGTNVIKFSFKTSTKGETTDDGVSPSEFNIDYFNIDCKGSDLPAASEIEKLEIGEFDRNSGVKVSEISPKIFAVYKNGLKVVLAKEDYDLAITGDGIENGKLKAGKFTVKVTMKADTSKIVSEEYEVEVKKETLTLLPSQATLHERNNVGGTNMLRTGNSQSVRWDEERGAFVSDGEKNMILGFDWSSTPKNVIENDVPTVTWNFAATGGTYTLSMKVNNAYVTTTDGGYTSNEFELKDVIKILVNGTEVEYKVKKTPVYTSERWEDLFNCMYEIEIADVALNAGTNTLKIEGKTTSGYENIWGETPAPRIEWVKFTSILLETPEVVSLDVRNIEYTLGGDVASVKPDVYAVYGNGDKVLLGEDEYRITFSGDGVEEGKFVVGKFILTVEYLADTSVYFEKEYAVTPNVETIELDASTVTVEEAHDGTSGNMLRTGSEEVYSYDSRTNTFTSLGNKNLILGFDWSSTPEHVSSIAPSVTWNFAANGGKYFLTMKIDNPYVTKPGDDNTHVANAYDLKEAIKIFVNGTEVNFSVSMPTMTDDGYERLFKTMFVVEIAEVNLGAGQNTLKIEGRTDCSLRNCWNEVPAPRIEWVKFTNDGESPAPAEKKIVSLTTGEVDYAYGRQKSDIKPEVFAIYDDGSREKLDSSLYTITFSGDAAEGDTLVSGTFTLTVTLNADASITTSKNYTVDVPTTNDIILNAADGVIFERNNAGGTNMLRHGDSETNEYDASTGTFVSKGSKNLILGLDWSSTPKNVVDGQKPSVTWTFNAAKGDYVLYMRLSNSYVTEIAGGNKANSYNLRDAIKITVNGTEVRYRVSPMPEMTSAGYEELFNCMFEIDVANVVLADGENILKIEGRSECALRNRWEEVPAPRIEWVKLSPSTSVALGVVSLVVKESDVHYGMAVSDIKPDVSAICDNGEEIWLETSEYTVSVGGTGVKDGVIGAGKVVVKATLNIMPTILGEREYTIASLTRDAITLLPGEATLFEQHDGYTTNNLQVADKDVYEYDSSNKTFTKTGTKSVISGFDWSTTAKNVVDGKNPTVTWNLTAAGGKYTFLMKINNLYVTQDSATGKYKANAFDLKEILKITVNGVEIDFGVSMPEVECDNWEPLFGYMFEVEIADITLNAGENVIVLEGRSECAYRDIWDEAPSPRIEWAKLTPKD